MSDTMEDTWLRAGEYVLGVLDAQELALVRHDAETDATLAHAIAFWESRFAPLTAFVPNVTPPAWLYGRIEAQIADTIRPSAQIIPFKRNSALRWWQTVAVGAMAAAAALAFVLLQTVRPLPVPPAAPAQILAVILPQPGVDASTGWVAMKDSTGAVHVTAFGKIAQVPDKYLELWFVPKGGAPVAVGHIAATAKDTRYALAAPASSIAALAVSQEPANQPLKGPTEIRYVGAVLD